MANQTSARSCGATRKATMSFTRERTTVDVSLSFLFQILFLLLTVLRTNAYFLVHDHSENYSTSLSQSDWMYDLATGAQHDEEWGMVQRKGNQFVVDGQPFYVNGFNTYWLMTLAVDQSTRGKVTDVLQQASMVGLTVCRTWAFSDGGWRALQKAPGVYDEDGFKALDFVVSEARRYKIRLIFPLVNNWEGYGGKGQYVQWGNASGLNLTSDDDFFSDPTVKKYYKSHVNVVLNRVNTFTNVSYKDDPTIFAWELMNEPECPSDPSGDKLQAWMQEMAFYVKSIDSAHLLSTGAEGFYGSSTPDRLHVNPDTHANKLGTDFVRNHQVMGIDYASAHIYPDIWLTNSDSDAKLHFLKTWMLNHIDDADNVLRMPIIFGEFGVSSKNNKIDKEFRNTFIDTVYKISLNSMKRGGSAGGCLLWQLFPEGTEYMDDGYAVVLTKSPSTANLLALQSKRIQNFNSKCSWICQWSCRRRNPMDGSKHDEL